MHCLVVVALIIASQVICLDAAERRISVSKSVSAYNLLKKSLSGVEKRATCTKEDRFDCDALKEQGFCDNPPYEAFMRSTCGAACGYCEAAPTPPPAACTKEDRFDCVALKKQGYCDRLYYKAFMRNTCGAACGYCIAVPTPPPAVDPQACLNVHNQKRAINNAEPLVWNATLAQHAKDWANHLASNRIFQHAPKTNEGENLFWGSGNPFSCVDAVEDWYSEVADYDYDNPPRTKEEFYAKTIGHFTQVVWKGTRSLGVSLATVLNSQGLKETYIVARYFPQGNILGQFAENVEPSS